MASKRGRPGYFEKRSTALLWREDGRATLKTYFRGFSYFRAAGCIRFVLRRFEDQVNVAINHFRAVFFFWEQATPSSLEIEEDCLRFVLRGKGPQRDINHFRAEFFFESKQRLLAWKLKREGTATRLQREADNLNVVINHFRAGFFLRASNAY